MAVPQVMLAVVPVMPLAISETRKTATLAISLISGSLFSMVSFSISLIMVLASVLSLAIAFLNTTESG